MNNFYYDIPENWYKKTSNNNYNKDYDDLASPKVSFIRGNLFNNLYNPYKNYKINELTPSNNKEELLYNILKYNFALTELDLYLDVYPNDSSMINLYHKYLEEKKPLIAEYEKNYGPLTLDNNITEKTPWEWLNSPWPWEEMK